MAELTEQQVLRIVAQEIERESARRKSSEPETKVVSLTEDQARRIAIEVFGQEIGNMQMAGYGISVSGRGLQWAFQVRADPVNNPENTGTPECCSSDGEGGGS